METLQEYLESPKKSKPEPKKLSIDESIDDMIGSPNTLLKKLSNIDKMTEREVYDIIRHTGVVLDYIEKPVFSIYFLREVSLCRLTKTIFFMESI